MKQKWLSIFILFSGGFADTALVWLSTAFGSAQVLALRDVPLHYALLGASVVELAFLICAFDKKVILQSILLAYFTINWVVEALIWRFWRSMLLFWFSEYRLGSFIKPL